MTTNVGRQYVEREWYGGEPVLYTVGVEPGTVHYHGRRADGTGGLRMFAGGNYLWGRAYGRLLELMTADPDAVPDMDDIKREVWMADNQPVLLTGVRPGMLAHIGINVRKVIGLTHPVGDGVPIVEFEADTRTGAYHQAVTAVEEEVQTDIPLDALNVLLTKRVGIENPDGSVRSWVSPWENSVAGFTPLHLLSTEANRHLSNTPTIIVLALYGSGSSPTAPFIRLSEVGCYTIHRSNGVLHIYTT